MNTAGPDATAEELLALETSALTRWCAGDPGGFLDLCAPDVVYFDPFLERRLDGLRALTAYYEAIRGQVSASRFEILNPLVHTTPHMAVLTYNFVSWGGSDNALRWNCTEVFRRDRAGGAPWLIVQTHWSFTQAGAPAA